MQFPPIKGDRGVLWISLRPDATAVERYHALRAVLKQCRLHPLDTTSSAEIVIVEAEAFHAHLDAIRAGLGEGDSLHLVSTLGDRLVVESIGARSGAHNPTAPGRPPWLADA